MSHHSTLDAVLDLLRCPVCRGGLQSDGRALRCASGHAFDIARQGYVSLLSGAAGISGDDAEMVRARERFLSTAAYEPVRDAVAALTGDARTVLDVGCGTGYYLAGVLDRLPDARGLGLDSSSRALRVAARAHERAAAAGCDVFRPLPLGDSTADAVLVVFAPRNPAEFRRVMRVDGRLVIARPTTRHHEQLRAHVPDMITVDPEKEQRLHAALDPFFEPAGTTTIEYVARLTTAEASDLICMTPSARHVAADAQATLPDEVTVSVLVGAYRPRQ